MVVLQRTKRYTTTLFNLSTVKEKKESFFFSFSDCCWFGSTLVFWSWSIRPHPKHSGCLWSLPHSSMFHSLLCSVFFFFFVSLLRMSHALWFSSVFHVEAKKKKSRQVWEHRKCKGVAAGCVCAGQLKVQTPFFLFFFFAVVDFYLSVCFFLRLLLLFLQIGPWTH